MDDYIAGIKSAWLGEQFGIAVFSGLAEAASDPEIAERWRTLARLEEVTGQRMAAVLESYGESPDSQLIDVEAVLERYTSESYLEVITDMKAVIEPAIERYDRLLGIAPEQDIDAVQFLVDHEIALLTFVEREIEGTGNSMEQVEALLG